MRVLGSLAQSLVHSGAFLANRDRRDLAALTASRAQEFRLWSFGVVGSTRSDQPRSASTMSG